MNRWYLLIFRMNALQGWSVSGTFPCTALKRAQKSGFVTLRTIYRCMKRVQKMPAFLPFNYDSSQILLHLNGFILLYSIYIVLYIIPSLLLYIDLCITCMSPVKPARHFRHVSWNSDLVHQKPRSRPATLGRWPWNTLLLLWRTNESDSWPCSSLEVFTAFLFESDRQRHVGTGGCCR